jgi:hypothetical protein
MNNIRSSYKYYKSEVDDPVDIKTYLTIVSDFIQFLMNKVFDGFEVKLPARLGSFQIIGRKVKPKLDEGGNVIGLAPNWAETKKLWDRDKEAKDKKELVYCFNEHTNGVKYKFLWSKKNVNVRNKGIYSIKFSRANKRKINDLLKNGKEYIVLNN